MLSISFVPKYNHHPTSLYSNPFICATNELGQGLIKRIYRIYLAPAYNASKVTILKDCWKTKQGAGVMSLNCLKLQTSYLWETPQQQNRAGKPLRLTLFKLGKTPKKSLFYISLSVKQYWKLHLVISPLDMFVCVTLSSFYIYHSKMLKFLHPLPFIPLRPTT